MDTEAIATEIVRLRNRLEELAGNVEGAGETDLDDERNRIHERMRELQDQLSAPASGESRSDRDNGESIQYVPPA